MLTVAKFNVDFTTPIQWSTLVIPSKRAPKMFKDLGGAEPPAIMNFISPPPFLKHNVYWYNQTRPSYINRYLCTTLELIEFCCILMQTIFNTI